MDFAVWTLVFAAALGSIALKIAQCYRNYGIAKSAGFPTFKAPARLVDVWWLALHQTLLPVFRLLPESWTEPWLSLNQNWTTWHRGHEPFRKTGSNSIMLSAPSGNQLWTCDPKVIQQVMTQPTRARVGVENQGFFGLYGDNLLTKEGPEWKRYRKIVTAGFNPATNAAVWKKATEQMNLLVDHLYSMGGAVPVIQHFTTRYALNVAVGVFFGTTLTWSEDDTLQSTKRGSMTLGTAISTVLTNIGWLFMLPGTVLRSLPSKKLQSIGMADEELRRYLRELHAKTVKRLDTSVVQKHKTIPEVIVAAGSEDRDNTEDQPLSAGEIHGLIFNLIFAGHETTGVTLGFIFLLSAIYPEYQKQIQSELDDHFKGRTGDSWSAEKDFPALYAGFVGAVQKEVLRLYHIVQFFPPREVFGTPLSVVDQQGVSHALPVGTIVCVNVPATFRNQNVWNDRTIDEARREEFHDSPALVFDPTRWLRDGAVENKEVVPESYFPFGVGPRTCPGKTFAQIKLTAAMVTLFYDNSIELVVSDALVAECGGDREKAWRKTRDRALRSLKDDITSHFSVEMLKELPIRLVKRR